MKTNFDKIYCQVIAQMNKSYFGTLSDQLRDGFCKNCGAQVDSSDFRDNYFERIYQNNGLCQKCQDEIYPSTSPENYEDYEDFGDPTDDYLKEDFNLNNNSIKEKSVPHEETITNSDGSKQIRYYQQSEQWKKRQRKDPYPDNYKENLTKETTVKTPFGLSKNPKYSYAITAFWGGNSFNRQPFMKIIQAQDEVEAREIFTNQYPGAIMIHIGEA